MIWNSKTLIAATGGTHHGIECEANAVEIDTRKLTAGNLFIALKGEHSDGHAHLNAAKQAGAVGALVSHIPIDAPSLDGFSYIMVENTEVALQDMARYRRNHSPSTCFIGITGSVGKTSAKEMSKLCFAAYGTTYASSGNFNNHLGLPISLCNMPANTEFGIFEMGMNHSGEISLLSNIAKPHLALITNVEAVHLENFDSVTGIAHAKAEIFEGLTEKGIAILPADNRHYPLLKQSSEPHTSLTFGATKTADLQFIERQGDCVTYRAGTQKRSFTLKLQGAHWPVAALGILAMIEALGLPLKPAEAALEHYNLPAGRGEIREISWQGGRLTLIDDAYNASPISMKAALNNLANHPTNTRKIAILGDMLELGEKSKQYHRELAPLIADSGIDGIITVGSLMQNLVDSVPINKQLAHFGTATQANNELTKLLKADDIVLCKGSHGSGVHKLVSAIDSK